MISVDYENTVTILRDIHWVGFHDDESDFHCNPYLILDEADIIFIDPGSIPHFHKVMRKVIDLVNPEEISFLIAHHQDPDVCGNLAVVEDIINRKDLKICSHTEMIRFIRHLSVKSEFYAVDKNDFRLKLKSGRILDFIFTPHLHSPGAIITYDRKTKTLFSSDIFGGISSEWTLFAESDFLTPIKTFHQAYMPANTILKACMEKLERLEIDRILPQHGSILEGDQVTEAIDFLKNLPCGHDLR